MRQLLRQGMTPEEILLRAILRLHVDEPLPKPSLSQIDDYLNTKAFHRFLAEIPVNSIRGKDHWIKIGDGLVEAATPKAMWMEIYAEKRKR